MLVPDEVPALRRKIQVGFSVLSCLVAAGVVFGFAALKPVLYSEGVYLHVCKEGAKRCIEQDLRLNRMFTFATVLTNVAALPIGYILDTIGPRKTAMLGAIFFGLGNFCFGLESTTFDTYLTGYLLLSLGGPLIFLPSFQLSNTFPERSGLILSAVTGAFDASSLPYVGYRELYKRKPVSIRTFFWAYMSIAVAIFLFQFFLGTNEPYGSNSGPSESPDEAEPTERTALLDPTASAIRREEEVIASSFSRIHYGDAHDVADEEFVKEILSKKDPLAGQLFGQTAGQQIRSSWFVLITVYLCITMCRINFYIETAQEQLLWYTSDEALSDTLVTTFTVLLPLGGLAAVPFVGTLLDKRTTFDAFLALLGLGTLYGVFCMTTKASTQIIGIVFFTILRPTMYTTVSDYCAKVYSFKTFGTVYGLCNTLSGLFGLIQSPLDYMVKYTLHNNPTPVNISLLVAGIVANLALIWRIYIGTRSSDSKTV